MKDKAWFDDCLREVDGYYVYYPPSLGCFYSAGTLRQIADSLDEMNKVWDSLVKRDVGP
jgi:hypothetical protein